MKSHHSHDRYVIIGAGMQGTAVAYDIARFGKAKHIILADISARRAEKATERVNTLIGKPICHGIQLDARDGKALKDVLATADACCGAAHYALNEILTKASIDTGCGFCDMGGNTAVVKRQHKLDSEARNAGVTIIPDCGLAPGLGNILAARAIGKITCKSVQIRCGGLPRHPRPPLGYRLVFSPAGLTNEYTGMCVEIRNGKIVELPAFTEPEEIEFPEPVGRCEAFLTSGGTSTGPWSFLGKVESYGYKTVRYPGHYDKMKAFIDLGFLDTEPIDVNGVSVRPRELFHRLIGDRLRFPDDTDLVVLRVIADGTDSTGHPVKMIQELMDFHDETTGFSAMERTTGFSTAIVLADIARKRFPPGVHALEKIIDGDRFVAQLSQRNIKIKTVFQK